jgi:uncharacterized surface protein with fasciclin (FAS1) repeats
MKTNKIKLLSIVAVIATLFTSCSSDDDKKDTTIAGLASGRSDLSLLVQALDKAGLVATLQGAGPFTVFAPDNDAFIAAGFTSEFISSLPQNDEGLKQLLLNHVLSGSVQSTALVNDTYRKTLGKGAASSTNTLSMYVKVATVAGVTTYTLNGGAEVVEANIIAENGIIHIVDEVITLPTIVDHAAANSNFSTLVSLLSAQNLVTTLDGTSSSPFTVFAPLNSAFDTATLALYNGLSTSAKKTAVLTYHVITGANVLSNAIPASSPTFESGILNFSGTVITDEQNRQVNIVLTDVQCANGVIHAVDKVLLPNSVP